MNETASNDKTYVWDPLVRIFHWTLVVAFVIAYFTGDEENDLHVYAGYYILGVVAVRILWGFVGTKHARFGGFIASPAAVLDYLKGFVGAGSGRQYLGHNPAGGWMVIALLLSLLATGISGLQVYGLEGHGPLAQISSTRHLEGGPAANMATDPETGPGTDAKISQTTTRYDDDDDEHDEYGKYESDEAYETGEEKSHEDGRGGEDNEDEADENGEDENEEDEDREDFWEEIHEFLANFTVLLIFLHIGGVIASSIKQRQNLIKAMVSGYKRSGLAS